MVPFLKWAGGKRWLAASSILPEIPKYTRYIEPFLGSGAIYFALRPEKAILSDINRELITTYQVIRQIPNELLATLGAMQGLHCKEYYYKTRSESPESDLNIAARFLYLNRTCWNGLYRVNKKGNFNVPIGTKSSVLMPTDDFELASTILQSADLQVRDFEKTIDLAERGDLIFIDPPYTVQHNNNGFVKYNETIFSWDDQTRLCKSVKRAVDRGANVIITNADHPSIHELYSRFLTYRQAHRASILAGSAAARNRITEAIYFNRF